MHDRVKNVLHLSIFVRNAQKPGLIKDPYIYKPDSIMLDMEDAVAENQKEITLIAPIKYVLDCPALNYNVIDRLQCHG